MFIIYLYLKYDLFILIVLMGLDRFSNFILRTSNEGIEELNITNSVRRVATNHILFDLNFLIYQEIINIENDVNDIIKILLSLPSSINNSDIIHELLSKILLQPHWSKYNNNIILKEILDGYNEDEIITNFISFITSKILITNNYLSIIELVIFDKIINSIANNIEHIHQVNFIETIGLFFDGIPSFSKILEQRRRRIKNHYEGNIKKDLFKQYFEKLNRINKQVVYNLNYKLDDNNKYNDLLFDYFKWISFRFSIDKSIGPTSNFIINLIPLIEDKLHIFFPNINIIINNSTENGENDFKIFKYISSNNLDGDYCIHTTDSDFIHQILVQQSYYNIINRDITLSVCKYTREDTVQILESKLIIKNILESYSSLNNIEVTTNYKIIWDICLIFYFFGNDHLPASHEIGPELGVEFYLKNHYKALGKENIIEFNNNKIDINLLKLSNYLIKMNEFRNMNITKIILQRFFKINYVLIILFVDKLNLCFNDIIILLKQIIINKSKLLSKEEFDLLDEDNLMKKYNNLDSIEIDFKNEKKNTIFQENLKCIEDNLDYYEEEFNGLILYTKPYNVSDDIYQDLYDFITDKSISTFCNQQPQYYDHINFSDYIKISNNDNDNDNDNKVDNFLKKLYHLILTQFGNMTDYHTDNLTFYKYHTQPDINDIISFILQNNTNNITNNITNKWLNQIKEDNLDNSMYFNNITHHLIISPFLEEEKKKDININNLYIQDLNIFDYRNINPYDFLLNFK